MLNDRQFIRLSGNLGMIGVLVLLTVAMLEPVLFPSTSGTRKSLGTGCLHTDGPRGLAP
jgi:hypothetical protein